MSELEAETPRSTTQTTLQGGKDHIFFPALAISISAIAFSGFSFTYFGPIISGEYPASGTALHAHGWSFFLWYLFLPLQAILAATGRIRLHSVLGRLSPVLVVIMAFTGFLVLTVRVEEAMRNGGPPIWLEYGPLILSNLVLFLLFYGFGVRMALKNRLETHKRLIIVASAIALGAGSFRLVLFLSGFHPLSLPVGVLGCSLFIVAGMLYDALTRKSVHRVFWIGLVIMLVVEISLLPQVNEDAVLWINQWLSTAGEHLGVFYQPEPTVEF